MKRLYKTMMLAIMLTLFPGGFNQVVAMENQGEASAASGKHCIKASRIDEVDVISNRTIVFHMYNNKSWVNNLPYTCPNLYHEGFQYVLQVDKLCSTDIITVLNFHQKCGLGIFEPYKDESKNDNS